MFLNALPGKGVHVVTVNDYLARRDAEWMMPIYQMLGHDRRLHPDGAIRRFASRGVCLRHYLRNQQGTWL